MRRAVSEIMLTAQTAWERWEPWILVVLCVAWILLAIHFGADRAAA